MNRSQVSKPVFIEPVTARVIFASSHISLLLGVLSLFILNSIPISNPDTKLNETFLFSEMAPIILSRLWIAQCQAFLDGFHAKSVI
ncbi:MAG: hypothetical protein HQ583_04185 [Candidatus Abyssubacteria bacterium]|nr:hypothetical protein [Candidatus Abyssubacteria bacterium]